MNIKSPCIGRVSLHRREARRPWIDPSIPFSLKSVETTAKSGLPKRVYIALSALVGTVLLLLLATADLTSRPPEAVAGESVKPPKESRRHAEEKRLFQMSVRPFLKKYCFDCHGPETETEGIAFHEFDDSASVLKARKVWEKALAQIRAGAMPPADHDTQPSMPERKQVVAWLDKALNDFDCDLVDDPGRVTIRPAEPCGVQQHHSRSRWRRF